MSTRGDNGDGILRLCNDEDILTVEKTDDTVSSIKLDIRTCSGSLKNNSNKVNNDNNLDFIKNRDLNIDEISRDISSDKKSVYESNRSSTNDICNRANLDKTNLSINGDVANSNNSSLAESLKTVSDREDSLNNIEANDEHEPLSLILDDPTVVSGLNPDLDNDFYDYDNYNNSLECDSPGSNDNLDSELNSPKHEIFQTFQGKDIEVEVTAEKKNTETSNNFDGNESIIIVDNQEEKVDEFFQDISSDFSSFLIAHGNNKDYVNNFTISDIDHDIEESENNDSENKIKSSDGFVDFNFDFDKNILPTHNNSCVNKVQDNGIDVDIPPLEGLDNNINSIQDNYDDHDDDFGDFSDFNNTVVNIENNQNDNKNSIKNDLVPTLEKLKINDSSENNDCDFTNFIDYQCTEIKSTSELNVLESTDIFPEKIGETNSLPEEISSGDQINNDYDNFSTYQPFESATIAATTIIPSSSKLPEPTTQQTSTVTEWKNQNDINDDDDFGDFADFSSVPTAANQDWTPNIQAPVASNQDNDDFDDFDDFCTSSAVVETPQINIKESISRIDNKNVSLEIFFSNQLT